MVRGQAMLPSPGKNLTREVQRQVLNGICPQLIARIQVPQANSEQQTILPAPIAIPLY